MNYEKWEMKIKIIDEITEVDYLNLKIMPLELIT